MNGNGIDTFAGGVTTNAFDFVGVLFAQPLGISNKNVLRAMSLDMNVGDLSGGNQQKLMFAKCLEVKLRVLMLDEPTRGIDVAAKREIYRLIDDLTDEGLAILFISAARGKMEPPGSNHVRLQ